MIAKSSILKNLNTLETLYNSSPSNQLGLLYSKLAILELCGWIEDTMDNIVKHCVNRKTRDTAARERIVKEVVSSTFGFHYEKHFRQMLAYIIGEISLLRLEMNLDQKKFLTLKSTLGTLRKSRDIQAHTHLRSGNRRLDSPLITKAAFFRVYEGLADLEVNLKLLGY